MKAWYALCIVLALMILAAACSESQSVSEPAASQAQPAAALPQASDSPAAANQGIQLSPDKRSEVEQVLQLRYFDRVMGPTTHFMTRDFVSKSANGNLANCLTKEGNKIKVKGAEPGTDGVLGKRWWVYLRTAEIQNMTATHATFRLAIDTRSTNLAGVKHGAPHFIETKVQGNFVGDPPYIDNFISCKLVN